MPSLVLPCALHLQMGEASAEVWTNLGLSCFYAGQYDLCFSCFEKGLAQAEDALLPDIWYNIGQVNHCCCCELWSLCLSHRLRYRC